MQLVQLQRDLPLLKKSGLGLAAVSYDSQGVLRDFGSRKKIEFPLLSDHESEAIRAYGVVNREYRKGMGLDIDREQVVYSTLGYIPLYGIAYPAVFVLRPDGTIRWRSVSLGSELRLTGAAILEEAVGIDAETPQKLLRSGKIGVTLTADTHAAGLGNRIRVGVELKIPIGLHVYGPNAGAEFKGLSWKMKESGCWISGEPSYPEPMNVKFSFSEAETPVYEGTVRFTRELAVAPVLKASDPSVFQAFQELCLDTKKELDASGTISLQACDDRECFPPRLISADWKFDFLPPDHERVDAEFRREFEP